MFATKLIGFHLVGFQYAWGSLFSNVICVYWYLFQILKNASTNRVKKMLVTILGTFVVHTFCSFIFLAVAVLIRRRHNL